jgi:hypothetical protein
MYVFSLFFFQVYTYIYPVLNCRNLVDELIDKSGNESTVKTNII